MLAKINRGEVKRRIRHRIRKKISGSASRPRLAVFRSKRHIYAQLIDDAAGVTLASASTREKSVREKADHGGNVNAATQVGNVIAERIKKAGIEEIVFDRGGNVYHGRVKALADAARKGGIKF